MTEKMEGQPNTESNPSAIDEDLLQTKALIIELTTSAKILQQETEELRTNANALRTERDALQAEINSMQEQKQTFQSLLDEIKQLKQQAEDNKDLIAAESQAVSTAKQQFEELRAQTQATRDDLANRQGEVASKISEIHTAYDQIIQIKTTLFDNKTDEQGAVIKAIVTQIHESNVESKALLDETKRDRDSVDTQLKELQANTQTRIEAFQENFVTALSALSNKAEAESIALTEKSKADAQTLKGLLEAEIRTLLPDAGSAGLAGAYVAAKSKYAPVNFEYAGQKTDKFYLLKYICCFIAHTVKSYTVPFIYYAMFLGPLLFIAYYFYDLYDTLSRHTEVAITAQTSGSASAKVVPPQLSLTHTGFNKDLWMFRGVVSLPLVAISIFGWSSIRLYRRLYEEYNHKQRVMQLYQSFKEQIDQLEDKELKKALLAVMLTTVGDKPSLTMHKYDNGMGDLMSNLSLGGMMSALLKNQKQS